MFLQFNGKSSKPWPLLSPWYIQMREVYKPLQINTWIRLGKTATWEVNSNSATNYKSLNLSKHNLASFSVTWASHGWQELLNSHMSQVTYHLAHTGTSFHISSLKYKCQTLVLGGTHLAMSTVNPDWGFHIPWKCGYYPQLLRSKLLIPGDRKTPRIWNTREGQRGRDTEIKRLMKWGP